MTTINSLATLRQHDTALKAAIAAAIAPFGLNLERQAGLITEHDGKLKLTITTTFLPAGVESFADLAKKKWADKAPLLGLPADAYGKIIYLNGVAFQLKAVDVSKPKNNVTVQRCGDGKIYLTTATTVKIKLAATA